MAAGAGGSRWRLLTTGHRVAKGIGGVAGFLATLVTILLFLGWDPFDGGESALAAAATKTSDAGSARVVLARTIRFGESSVLDQAQGAIDFRAEIANLDHNNGLRQLFRKPFLYQRYPSPNEPVWCQYDLSILGRGFLFGSLTGFENDPAAALRNLEDNGSYEKVGDEVLFGISTTHYTGHVELPRLLEGEEDEAVRALLEKFGEYNDDRLLVDVWVSPDDFVRRLGTSFDVPGEDYGASGIVHVDATFDFDDYGTSVDAVLPPQEEIAQPGTHDCPLTA